MSHSAILTDVTKCIGCEKCVAACRTTYNTGKDRPWRWQKSIRDLSATRWTTIIRRPKNRFVRQHCRHCLEPACVSACPVGALVKTPEGPVIYDSNICLGCRYCMMACPFGIPRYTWSKTVPYVRKCILCHDKIKSGSLKEPACTAACPTGATMYGTRDKLIEEARRRIAESKDRYVDRIWGEKEVGGTSVLYVSDISLDFLGWQENLDSDPLPLTTRKALKTVPGIFAGVGAAATALYWVIGRRQRLATKKNEDK